MGRLLAIAAILTAAFASAPGHSQSRQASEYRAELATPASSNRLVVRDTVWRCAGGTCTAGKSNSRPAIACAALAREAGTLRSFTAEGSPLAPEELEKCNARAR